MSLKDILVALTGARQTIGEIDSKLSDLRTREAELVAHPPHRDDLIEWLRRGIKNASDVYLHRLENWYFQPEVLARQAGTWFEENKSANLLCVPRTVPVHGTPSPGTGDDLYHQDISLMGLTHFIAPLIDAQIPALIDRLMPTAANGLKSADRAKQLTKVRDEISMLEKQRTELFEQLDAARKAAA